MRVKVLITFVLLLGLTSFITGCGNTKQSTQTSTQTPTQTSKTLNIYDLPSSYMAWKDIAQAYAQKTGIQPTLDLKKGSGTALAALEMEDKNNTHIGNGAFYGLSYAITATNEGLHQPYKPTGFDKLPGDFKESNGLWWAISQSPIVINVNTDVLNKKGLPAPQSWADLLKPEYKGMVFTQDATYGGTAYAFAYSMNFILGGTDTDFRPGFKYLKALKDNGGNFGTETLTPRLVSGEYPITIDTEGNGLTAKYNLNAPVQVVIPQEGVSPYLLAMGLAKGAPEADETKKFYDWLLSDETQGLITKLSYFRPVIPGTIPAEIADRFHDLNGKFVSYDQIKAAGFTKKFNAAFTAIIQQGADIDTTLRKEGLLQ